MHLTRTTTVVVNFKFRAEWTNNDCWLRGVKESAIIPREHGTNESTRDGSKLRRFPKYSSDRLRAAGVALRFHFRRGRNHNTIYFVFLRSFVIHCGILRTFFFSSLVFGIYSQLELDFWTKKIIEMYVYHKISSMYRAVLGILWEGSPSLEDVPCPQSRNCYTNTKNARGPLNKNNFIALFF